MKKFYVHENDKIFVTNDKTKIGIRIKNINVKRVKFNVNAPENLEVTRREIYDKAAIERLQTMEFYSQKLENSKKQIDAFYAKQKYQPKVLVVEDSSIAQMIIRDNLTELNCKVDIVETGEEAMHLFNDNYDLIIMDIGLPDISGIKICRMIRKKQTRPVFIIIWTAYGDEMKEKSFDAGADDFVIKTTGMKIIEEYISKIRQNKSY